MKMFFTFFMFIIGSSCAAYIVVITGDTHKILSEVLDKAIVYISLLGIPFLLYIISNDYKNTFYNFSNIQKKYWKNIKKISLSERENIPFPVDIDIKKTKKTINELIVDLEHLEENIDYYTSKLSEGNSTGLFETLNLYIPNGFIRIKRDLYQLIILEIENAVKLKSSKSTLKKIEKYKDELKKYIETASFID